MRFKRGGARIPLRTLMTGVSASRFARKIHEAFSTGKTLKLICLKF
jgi:hypothetical protein